MKETNYIYIYLISGERKPKYTLSPKKFRKWQIYSFQRRAWYWD